MIKDNNKKKGQFLEKHNIIFSSIFLIVCVLTFSFLYLFDLVPDEFKTVVGRFQGKEYTGNQVGEAPLKIQIPKIGVNAEVYNPATTTVSILDNYLLKGAVHYPGSSLLGGEGNVFIFGHSTGFAIVNNQAFKTFNNLKNLKQGDLINVSSDKNVFVYKVLSVKLIGAEKELIEFNTTGKKLTLSTCNTFGAKSERYVVEADFVTQ
jgi:LPXTG-site transpeptidase (sortase) family protein